MLKIEDIANAINDAREAVDRSSFGPIFTYAEQGNLASKQLNPLAFSVFQIVLQQVLKDKLNG